MVRAYETNDRFRGSRFPRVKGGSRDSNPDIARILSGTMDPFAQSMIVSALTASEGNHVTSIVHCDAVPTSYLGMDFDPETLLYLEGGRPYDPAAGRYLTAGSMASGTYNIYAFANNTPVDRSVRDVRGAGMQGIVGGSPIGACISALVDGVVDSIWSTINSFKDGAIAAGEHIRASWYELSDDNWDAFQSRQSDFFRSWVSHSTFQQLLEPLWLNQKHGPVTTFATPPSWLESERAAFKTYFETSNGTTSWGYGERFAPLGDEIIVTVVSSVTGRLIPPGAATLARSSRFLIKHLDDVIDVGVDGGRVIARVSNAPKGTAASISHLVSGSEFTGGVADLTAALRQVQGHGSSWLRRMSDRFDAMPDSVHLLDDPAFAEAAARHGVRSAAGFYNGGAIFLKRSRGDMILRDFVHEGTHAMDFGVGGVFSKVGGKHYAPSIRAMTPLQTFKLELRAFRAERLVDGVPAHGGGRSLIDYILKHYNAVEPW